MADKVKRSERTFDFSQPAEVRNEEVECLGLEFASDQERLAHFAQRLRDKLKEPAFRGQEGFPQGTDEDIVRLSNPPFYTACPNPFLEEFIRCHGRPYDPAESYRREPFATDVSEGKADLLYSAHTYHTKVPPRAIARFILHYTKPGDVVLDAFCGSGMTGVAAGLCGDPLLAQESRAEAGPRTVILCDLSPAATFIASVYLNPPEPTAFRAEARTLITGAQDITDLWSIKVGESVLPVEYQMWAEVFVCPLCQSEVVSEQVVNPTDEIGIAKAFQCPHCRGLVSKAPSKNAAVSKLERHLVGVFDPVLQREIKTLRRRPLFVMVDRGGSRERVEHPADEPNLPPSDKWPWFPTAALISGERYVLKDYCHSYGITHVHHFYLPRQLFTFARLWQQVTTTPDNDTRRSLMFLLQSNGLGITVLNRYSPTHYSQVSQYFSGTLYVPSAVAETSPLYTYRNKVDRLTKAFAILRTKRPLTSAITTQSASSIAALPDNSIDYVFVDPPFGRNLQYSELNQVWEAWIRVKTGRDHEAVIDDTRERDVLAYGDIMSACFRELYRVLKPGRWATVEFHNSSNAVWFALQEALVSARFVVGDVKILSKQKETYKQSRQGLIKQDLVISAYKPTGMFLDRMKLAIGTETGVWEFVAQHLSMVPVAVDSSEGLSAVPERDPYVLFDRMLAYHVQGGVTVPLSASEFFAGLEARFAERDGMYFVSEQVAEYDRRRSRVSSIRQLELFVDDEATAIRWLRKMLVERPMTLQRIHPEFIKRLQSWTRHETQIELLELLDQNFVCYEGEGSVPSQIHKYLSTNYKELRNLSKSDEVLVRRAKGRWYVPDPAKAVDLERVRQATLQKEFNQYVESPQRRLKVFRTEAVRAGFKAAYDTRDYDLIVRVADKLPETVLQEDEQLLMYFDVASTRLRR